MKIEICNICEGVGETSQDIGGHQSDYVYSTCKQCEGTGKIYKNKYYFDIIMPISKQQEMYKIDAEIWDKLKKN